MDSKTIFLILQYLLTLAVITCTVAFFTLRRQERRGGSTSTPIMSEFFRTGPRMKVLADPNKDGMLIEEIIEEEDQ